ncbi:MAG: hypothetical protein FWD58_07045 [Firmicutes bacterium]|nr:hypothetical protein [Bacillota bacterium]
MRPAGTDFLGARGSGFGIRDSELGTVTNIPVGVDALIDPPAVVRTAIAVPGGEAGHVDYP